MTFLVPGTAFAGDRCAPSVPVAFTSRAGAIAVSPGATVAATRTSVTAACT